MLAHQTLRVQDDITDVSKATELLPMNRRLNWFDHHEGVTCAFMVLVVAVALGAMAYYLSPPNVMVEESVTTGVLTARDASGKTLTSVPDRYQDHVYVH